MGAICLMVFFFLVSMAFCLEIIYFLPVSEKIEIEENLGIQNIDKNKPV